MTRVPVAKRLEKEKKERQKIVGLLALFRFEQMLAIIVAVLHHTYCHPSKIIFNVGAFIVTNLDTNFFRCFFNNAAMFAQCIKYE